MVIAAVVTVILESVNAAVIAAAVTAVIAKVLLCLTQLGLGL